MKTRFVALMAAGTLSLLGIGMRSHAADTLVAKAQPPVHGGAESPLLLTAPPREGRQEAEAWFGPVAEFLSRVLDRRVVYAYPGNWGAYQALMQKGTHDIVFDAPHFTG